MAVQALCAVAPGVPNFIAVGSAIEYTLLYFKSLQTFVEKRVCILLLENGFFIASLHLETSACKMRPCGVCWFCFFFFLFSCTY